MGSNASRFAGFPASATSSISPPSFKTSRPWPCACSDHRLNWRKRELGRQYHLSTRTQQLSSKTTAKQVIGLTNPANLANHRVFRQHRPEDDRRRYCFFCAPPL